MSVDYHKAQFLVARDVWGCLNHILSATGERAISAADDASADLLSIGGWNEDDVPRVSGLWIWSGHVESTRSMAFGEVWVRSTWTGEWKRAGLDDLRVFGVIPGSEEP